MAKNYSFIKVRTSRDMPLGNDSTMDVWWGYMRAVINGMFATGGNNAPTTDAISVWDGTSLDLAQNTIEFSDHATQGDTITIGGLVFTARTSASTSVQFTVGADATASASNLADKINAHSTLSKVCSAYNTLGVLTIQALFPGVIGNFISLSKSCSVATIGGSGLALEGGGTTTLSSAAF